MNHEQRQEVKTYKLDFTSDGRMQCNNHPSTTRTNRIRQVVWTSPPYLPQHGEESKIVLLGLAADDRREGGREVVLDRKHVPPNGPSDTAIRGMEGMAESRNHSETLPVSPYALTSE